MNAVIGTAGHVDHGKSSLIEALTGIHPSHLPQEIARSMTIDLGFAYFTTPDQQKIGIIDVPGHERFIRNMVKAVWGLDLVLFVVAADDGWAALSTEHLHVIAAMDIKSCILVITKADLVDERRLKEVENDSLEHFLTEMDMIPDVINVSSYTGAGIDNLKQLIIDKINNLPQREELDNQAHLYVDRVFSVNGIGTTVTGTLRGGEINVGDVLTLFPGNHAVKVRSLQSYHQQLNCAQPYSRTAIGLKQLNRKLVTKGSCLVAKPQAITMSTDWIVQLNPNFSSFLKKQSIVEVALGTAHVLAKCYVYAEGKLARLQLVEAIPAFWGQPLLLIQHGGSHIIGAGRVVWLQSIDTKKRNQLQSILADLSINSANRLNAQIMLQLAVNGYSQQKKGIAPPLNTLTFGPWWITPETKNSLKQQCDDYLNSVVHMASAEELARITGYPIALIELIAEEACQAKQWQKIDGNITTVSQLQDSKIPANQQQLLDDIAESGEQGYDASKTTIVGIRRLLRSLTEKQLIVPTENDLFFTREIYQNIVCKIMSNRKLSQRFSVADARECTGLSRKQLIPLLNRLERDGWVKRVDNEREVIKEFSC
ncbi:selenocysteine-specific translation elongation factor [Gilliamella sp. wkB178]|uniref:selenocysteine-specific translation elongation factor n=1 Tax=Gilliamella sp. wkB178 TaxID=3120259 RepID=UPI00080E8708|nr:selenocysteine-specific translation elongation factor [Gilliamella apicola]OCG06510.1 selenocysteine-specific translation elongation factor [Gilliamella apicola]